MLNAERPTSAKSVRSVRSNASRYSNMSAEEITAEYVTKRSSGAPSPQPSHHSNHRLEGAATDFDMLRPQENHRLPKKVPPLSPPQMPRSFKNRKQMPGPGSYEVCGLTVSSVPDRHGSTTSSKFSFGMGERSFIKHAVAQSTSPGPAYLTNKPPIFARPGFSFGTDSKFAKTPHNAPLTVPGPGKYCGTQVGDMKGSENWKDAPGASFGLSNKHSVVSYGKAIDDVENLGLSSPGPKYNVRQTDKYKFPNKGDYTIGVKVPGENDVRLRLSVGAGPAAYTPLACRDGRGQLCKDATQVGFTKADKRLRGDLQFITPIHAETTNKCLHSPGPIYDGQLAPRRYPNVSLRSQGSADRFFDPFEPGRLHEGFKRNTPMK